MSQMLAEVTSAPSVEAVYQHTIQSGEDEILNVTLVPELSDMITKEESGTNWLDTVGYMLVKFQIGSRTDACFGPIIHYWFSQENAEKFKNEPLVMSVVSFQVKDGCENDFLDTVCASPLNQLKIQRLIIRSDDRYYHSISIDSLERKIENEAKGLDYLDKLEPYLDFFGDSRTKASSGVVTTWANPNFD